MIHVINLTIPSGKDVLLNFENSGFESHLWWVGEGGFFVIVVNERY